MTGLASGTTAAVVGFGLTGRAVTASLLGRGITPVVLDDRPGEAAMAAAETMGVDLIAAPDRTTVQAAVDGADALLPTPGLPDAHPAFEAAERSGVPVMSEFDLARLWDDRPIIAITRDQRQDDRDDHGHRDRRDRRSTGRSSRQHRHPARCRHRRLRHRCVRGRGVIVSLGALGVLRPGRRDLVELRS